MMNRSFSTDPPPGRSSISSFRIVLSRAIGGVRSKCPDGRCNYRNLLPWAYNGKTGDHLADMGRGTRLIWSIAQSSRWDVEWMNLLVELKDKGGVRMAEVLWER